MMGLMLYATLGGMVGLFAYELLSEVREGKHQLKDRYHE